MIINLFKTNKLRKIVLKSHKLRYNQKQAIFDLLNQGIDFEAPIKYLDNLDPQQIDILIHYARAGVRMYDEVVKLSIGHTAEYTELFYYMLLNLDKIDTDWFFKFRERYGYDATESRLILEAILSGLDRRVFESHHIYSKEKIQLINESYQNGNRDFWFIEKEYDIDTMKFIAQAQYEFHISKELLLKVKLEDFHYEQYSNFMYALKRYGEEILPYLTPYHTKEYFNLMHQYAINNIPLENHLKRVLNGEYTIGQAEAILDILVDYKNLDIQFFESADLTSWPVSVIDGFHMLMESGDDAPYEKYFKIINEMTPDKMNALDSEFFDVIRLFRKHRNYQLIESILSSDGYTIESLYQLHLLEMENERLTNSSLEKLIGSSKEKIFEIRRYMKSHFTDDTTVDKLSAFNMEKIRGLNDSVFLS